MFISAKKMEDSLRDLRELIHEVENNLLWPKRYRRYSFQVKKKKKKPKYLAYLNREAKFLAERIKRTNENTFQKAGPQSSHS